jgi:hypothetical protein
MRKYIYQQQSAEILVSNAMQRVSTRSLFVDKIITIRQHIHIRRFKLLS